MRLKPVLLGVLVSLVVATPIALVWWSRYEPLPSPSEGEAIVVSTAQRGGEHSGVTAACRPIGRDEDVLGCRLRDDEGRYGWGEVWVGERKVESYRGTERHDVVRSRAGFPLSADGVAEIDFRDPGRTDAGLEAALLFVLRDSLGAAGYDWYVFPTCPPLAPGGTVRCRLGDLPATVEVSRASAGEERSVRLEILPLP